MTEEEESELDKLAKSALYSDYNPTPVDHILYAIYWVVGVGLSVWWVVELL